MKVFKNILAILLILLISVITFFSFNLLFSVVSNYQSITPVAMAGIPMLMFMSEIIIFMVALFNKYKIKRNDPYFFRKYSIMEGCFAIVGATFSIVAGTYIYHSFVGDYIFFAYPLVMLIVHLFVLAVSLDIAIISIRIIAKEKPAKPEKNPKLYGLKEVLVSFLLVFALERLGAFVLLPVFWSGYDSVYVIPFYIELLIPAFMLVIYLLQAHVLHNKKLTLILSSSALAYTVFALIYMLVISHNNYPLTINPLSPILQLERLVTKPYGSIILFGFGIVVPALFILNMVTLMVKEKKSQE